MRALLLLIVMLVACASPTQKTNPPPAAAAESAAPAATDAPGSAPDPFGAYRPAIDIHFVRDIDDDLLTNILPKCPGETITNNRWLQLYEDKLGIRIKYDWIAKTGDAYTQKLNVVLASGNLPDVIGVDPTQLKQLADSDMVADLTSLWGQYASAQLKQYYMTPGSNTLDMSTIDGRLLGISSTPELFGDGTFIWIRNDWLKKLGLQPPRTMKDVLNISQAFAEEDPDGNGLADTFGLAITKELYNGCMGLEGFFAGYHAYPYMWVQGEDGKLVYGSTLPAVKTSLQVLADLFRAGQIDQEFAVKDVGKVAQAVAQGQVGMEFGVQWNPMYPLITNYQRDPNADWEGYPLVSCDEEPVKSPLRAAEVTRLWAVRKGYAHPEALIKLMNMHVEMCWGPSGDFNKYYMPAENGSVGVWKFSPITPYPPYKNLNAYMNIETARKNQSLDRLTGEARTIQRNLEAFTRGDTTQWGWMKIYGPEGVFRWSAQYQKNGQFFYEQYTGAPTKTMVEKKTMLLMMEKEYFTKIIMGSVDIGEFARFVSDWNKLGGADMTREVNQWYQDSQTK